MEEFYKGKDIIVRFDCFEDGKDVTPAGGYVEIYDPDRKYIKADNVEIIDSEVRYVLEGELVEKAGIYSFVFNISIRGLGDYPHVTQVEVKDLPIAKEEQWKSQKSQQILKKT